ncbi:phosphonate ABC transporter permease, partial [Bacillus cereus]|nr:phosphonate ABC transporter permease [Bacillus cereus]
MPFLGSVYQIFGLYPELYYGMISAELQEEAQK